MHEDTVLTSRKYFEENSDETWKIVKDNAIEHLPEIVESAKNVSKNVGTAVLENAKHLVK